MALPSTQTDLDQILTQAVTRLDGEEKALALKLVEICNKIDGPQKLAQAARYIVGNMPKTYNPDGYFCSVVKKILHEHFKLPSLGQRMTFDRILGLDRPTLNARQQKLFLDNFELLSKGWIDDLRIKLDDPYLSELSFCSIELLNRRFFQAMQTNTTVKSVVVRESPVRDDFDPWSKYKDTKEIKKITRFFAESRLISLTFRYDYYPVNWWPNLLAALEQNNSLTFLDMGHGNGTGVNGLKLFAKILELNAPPLRVLKLCSIHHLLPKNIPDHRNNTPREGEMVAFKAFTDGLTRNTTLIELDFSDNGLKDDGAVAFAKALKSNSTLRKLYLIANMIGLKGTEALSQSLMQNTSLTGLYIGQNTFGDEGAIHLAIALANNHTLRELDINSNGIGMKGGVSLANSLQANTSLKKLLCDYNHFGETGGEALGAALVENSSLEVLECATNGIGDAGAEKISEALLTNRTLMVLNLNFNDIRARGAIKIGAALGKNTTLVTLDIGRNTIGTDGTKALSSGLKANRSLKVLRCCDINGGREGTWSITEALKYNTSLVELDCREDTDLDNYNLENIGKMLEVNTSLQTLFLQRAQQDGLKCFSESLKVNRTLHFLSLWINQAVGNALIDILHSNKTLRKVSSENYMCMEREEIRDIIKRNEEERYSARCAMRKTARVMHKSYTKGRSADDTQLAVLFRILPADVIIWHILPNIVDSNLLSRRERLEISHSFFSPLTRGHASGSSSSSSSSTPNPGQKSSSTSSLSPSSNIR